MEQQSGQDGGENEVERAAAAGEALRHSFAGRLGHLIEPVIAPLGFDWKIGIGLIASFAAREVFVGSMGVIFGVEAKEDDTAPIREAMRAATWTFDFVSPFAFIAFRRLGELPADVAKLTGLSDADLAAFPHLAVRGHRGVLRLGRLSGKPVAVLMGRQHAYETGEAHAMKGAIRTLAALGCQVLLQTNAAGSLRLDMPPGALMAITDHINFTGVNPLFDAGPERRFVDMIDAYDPELTGQLLAAARKSGIACQAGVYIWFCGPSFETPAEIRAAKALGADAVGMSTAPETILARHAGLKVVGLSVITNLGAGLEGASPSHEETKSEGAKAVANMKALLAAFMAGA